jgi:hypothetical protein
VAPPPIHESKGQALVENALASSAFPVRHLRKLHVEGRLRRPFPQNLRNGQSRTRLKYVTVSGMTAFQLQWSVGPCTKHEYRDRAARNRQCKSPVKGNLPAKRGVMRLIFTPNEDDLLIRLKNQGLSWEEIHRQYKKAFPQRERGMGSLQVRYCTKLKRM